eukprot:ctg_100.g104
MRICRGRRWGVIAAKRIAPSTFEYWCCCCVPRRPPSVRGARASNAASLHLGRSRTPPAPLPLIGYSAHRDAHRGQFGRPGFAGQSALQPATRHERLHRPTPRLDTHPRRRLAIAPGRPFLSLAPPAAVSAALTLPAVYGHLPEHESPQRRLLCGGTGKVPGAARCAALASPADIHIHFRPRLTLCAAQRHRCGVVARSLRAHVAQHARRPHAAVRLVCGDAIRSAATAMSLSVQHRHCVHARAARRCRGPQQTAGAAGARCRGGDRLRNIPPPAAHASLHARDARPADLRRGGETVDRSRPHRAAGSRPSDAAHLPNPPAGAHAELLSLALVPQRLRPVRIPAASPACVRTPCPASTRWRGRRARQLPQRIRRQTRGPGIGRRLAAGICDGPRIHMAGVPVVSRRLIKCARWIQNDTPATCDPWPHAAFATAGWCVAACPPGAVGRTFPAATAP